MPHCTSLISLRHNHAFALGSAKGESRTRIVLWLTLGMMVVEIAVGWWSGSLALLADGWHMGTHAAALGIAAFTYRYAREHAGDPRFSFGTGKVGPLGGFASALILGVVALGMVWESVQRWLHPEPISFDQALVVAAIGLGFNLLSAWLLGHGHDHGHDHGHAHDHAEGGHAHADHHGASGEDLNLRAAYVHVLADALTSVFAIAALLAGKYAGWAWLDALVGLLGAVVIGKWAIGLLRETGLILLDSEMDQPVVREIREAIEGDGDSAVADLHVQRVGVGQFAVVATIVTHRARTAEEYRERLCVHEELVHFNLEVQHCRSCAS